MSALGRWSDDPGYHAYEGGQVVDGDDGHPGVTLADLDLDGRLGEGSVDRGVDGDRVVRVGRAIEWHGSCCVHQLEVRYRCAECVVARTHSHETSTTTLNLLSGPAWAIKSVVKNLGMGVAK